MENIGRHEFVKLLYKYMLVGEKRQTIIGAFKSFTFSSPYPSEKPKKR